MKSQVLHTVQCNISAEAAGEIWHWSLLGVKGLKLALLSKWQQIGTRMAFPCLITLSILHTLHWMPEKVSGYFVKYAVEGGAPIRCRSFLLQFFQSRCLSWKDLKPFVSVCVQQLVPSQQCCGGVSGDNLQSYTATVISAAKVCSGSRPLALKNCRDTWSWLIDVQLCC